MTRRRTCCCQDGLLWYALKCETYFEDYCCAPDCTNAPARIEFCPRYLLTMGIPDPPDLANKCYYIRYDCCIYILTNFETTPCPNPESPWPVNVGELVKVKNRVAGENPCCYPDQQQQGNPGGIANIQIPEYGQAIANRTNFPCEETVAECYDFKDQAGTVKGKGVTIASTASTCIETYGVPWDVRCDHGPPVTIDTLSVAMSQEMSFCRVLDDITSCPNQVTRSFRKYMECPDCDVEGDCCGNTTGNCAQDPDFCDTELNRFETYDVKTCYSINSTGCATHDEDIMTIKFSACAAPNIDPESQGAQAALNALFLGSSGLVHIDQANTVATGWGTLGAPKLSVCGLDVVIFSGNAAHIAERINTRIGGLVSASGIAPWSAYFWFGNRQSCVKCDWQTANDRPGFAVGDTLTVDRVAFTDSNTTITVTLRASALRYYACAAQTLIVDYPWRKTSANTCNAAISATSAVPNNYVLQCLSFPEYAFGERYTMKRIQEYGNGTIQICVDIGFYQPATNCEARAGWPLEDITVNIGGNDIVLVYGWDSLCAAMPDPRTGCYAYPFVYTPAPCCPAQTDCTQWAIDHPLPQPCVRSFQYPNVYCKSDGTVIGITS